MRLQRVSATTRASRSARDTARAVVVSALLVAGFFAGWGWYVVETSFGVAYCWAETAAVECED
jgi:hypothetical protein